jgi:glycosyltransferase involved in cell wall biosynthesis
LVHLLIGKMSSKQQGNKIAIIGPYPPPYGGISVHIKRILSYYKDGNIVFYNETKTKSPCTQVSFSKYVRYFVALTFLFKKFKLIHHHSPDRYMRLWLCFLGLLGKNIYIHIHGASLVDSLGKKGIISSLTKLLLKHVNVLACNEEIHEFVQQYHPKSVYLLDAYLPPIYEKDVFDKFLANVKLDPDDINLTTVGWFKEYNHEDLYGFDLMIEALDNVKKIFPKKNIMLYASINGIVDDDIFLNFKTKLTQYRLDDSIVLLNESFEEVWPLFIIGDIFIRATNTDGGSVSVKEAIWAESSVLASDVVPRPAGITLFKQRSAADLTEKLTQLIAAVDKKITIRKKIEIIKSKSFSYQFYEQVYN